MIHETTIVLGLVCLCVAAVNVISEWKAGRAYVLATKVTASSLFLTIGVLNFGNSTYDAMIMAALAFSWVGDVLLVWRGKAALLAGIAAFLAAHIGYSVAFAQLPLTTSAFVTAMLVWNTVVLFVVRWLWQYLDGPDRYAVLIYMAAVTVMISLAAATMFPLIGVAAGLFAISDISVARDRFIERSIANKVWGIPLYYLAQILFASSMLGVD